METFCLLNDECRGCSCPQLATCKKDLEKTRKELETAKSESKKSKDDTKSKDETKSKSETTQKQLDDLKKLHDSVETEVPA